MQLRSRGKSNEGLNGILLKLFPILLLHGKRIVRTLIINIEIKRLMRSLKLNLRKVRVLEQGMKKVEKSHVRNRDFVTTLIFFIFNLRPSLYLEMRNIH